MTDAPRPGLEGTAETEVTEELTAPALGSGDVDVLGTPAVLALAERAAVRALEGRLGPDRTSVGSWVELTHLAPTPRGARVRATARLVEVEGSRLTFEFSVSDPAGEVATGRHGRVVVPRGPFLETASARGGR
ncbi:MAG: thioesterase [Actinobacteria bacterium]|nr:thioesterase [Actinomycetota bacterium]